jgi:hypothetical protein
MTNTSSHFSINYSSVTSAHTLYRLLFHILPILFRCVFYVGHIHTNFLFSNDFYSDSTQILTTIAGKQCMDIHCSFHVFNFCLNSRRWFTLCLVYIPHLVLKLVSTQEDQGLKLTIYIQLLPRSRIRGSIYPLLHTPLWLSSLLVKHKFCFHLYSFIPCIRLLLFPFSNWWILKDNSKIYHKEV